MVSSQGQGQGSGNTCFCIQGHEIANVLLQALPQTGVSNSISAGCQQSVNTQSSILTSQSHMQCLSRYVHGALCQGSERGRETLPWWTFFDGAIFTKVPYRTLLRHPMAQMAPKSHKCSSLMNKFLPCLLCLWKVAEDINWKFNLDIKENSRVKTSRRLITSHITDTLLSQS